MLLNFKEWLQLQEIEVSQQVALSASSSSERDIGRESNGIVATLLKKKDIGEVLLFPPRSKEDIELKIDGRFLTGEYAGKNIQIKRRIQAGSKEDFAIRLTDHYDTPEEVAEKNIKILYKNSQFNMDKLQSHLYILLNTADDKLFFAPKDKIKQAIDTTLEELENDRFFNGTLLGRRLFKSSNGCELRLTYAREGWGIVIFIPAEPVSDNIVTTSPKEVEEATTEYRNAVAEEEAEKKRKKAEADAAAKKAEEERKAKLKKSEAELAIDRLLQTKSPQLLPLIGNKNAIDNKKKTIQDLARKNNVKTSFDPKTNVMTLTL